MAKMRVVQVPRPKGPLELVERDIPEPQQGTVRVRVQACGICHSDTVTKDGLLPGIEYPRVPGHEVIGIVDAVGPDVSGWTGGERVGIGWHGGYCGYCGNCRRGGSLSRRRSATAFAGRSWRCAERAQCAALQGRQPARLYHGISQGAPGLHRQTDRAVAKLRCPSCHRDGKSSLASPGTWRKSPWSINLNPAASISDLASASSERCRV